MKQQKIFLLFILPIIISGCGLHSYTSALYYIPAKAQKNEINIAGSLGPTAYNGNVAYAISENTGVSFLANSRLKNELSTKHYKRNIFEISGYYFGNKKSSKLNYGIIGGAGIGKATSHNYVAQSIYTGGIGDNKYINLDASYNHFYLAPFVSATTRSKTYSLSFSVRISYLMYSEYNVSYTWGYNSTNQFTYDEYSIHHPTVLVIEPTFKHIIGKGRLKMLHQITIPFPCSDLAGIKENTQRFEIGRASCRERV